MHVVHRSNEWVSQTKPVCIHTENTNKTDICFIKCAHDAHKWYLDNARLLSCKTDGTQFEWMEWKSIYKIKVMNKEPL